MALLAAMLVFTSLPQYLMMYERMIARIELSETLMVTGYTLFQFSRYSSSAELLLEGKKLKLNFPNNGIVIYQVNETLVVLNKGAANPIAEWCDQEAGFRVEKFSQNNEILKISVPFSFGKKHEELVLLVGPHFWKR
ncbi:MAG: hypothetical protein ABDK94_01160 [Atribacterota bacterium]